MEGYRAGRECGACKGRCCRERGCSLSPEDMLQVLSPEDTTQALSSENMPRILPPQSEEEKAALKEALLRTLSEGDLYAIDCFHEGGSAFYYLRMRHKCYTFIGVEAMGECIALTEQGCRLSEEKRPKGGRFLESRPDGRCVQHYTKEEMLRDWEPYQPVLKEIWNIYYARFTEDGTFDACDEANFAWMRECRNSMRQHVEQDFS